MPLERESDGLLFYKQDDSSPNLPVWSVMDKLTGLPLGLVKWWGGSWRQNVFVPFDGPVFTADRLKEIASFVQDHNK